MLLFSQKLKMNQRSKSPYDSKRLVIKQTACCCLTHIQTQPTYRSARHTETQNTSVLAEKRKWKHQNHTIVCVCVCTTRAAHLVEPPAGTGSLDHIVFAALPVPPVCSARKLLPHPASARPELGTRLARPAASCLVIQNRHACSTKLSL